MRRLVPAFRTPGLAGGIAAVAVIAGAATAGALPAMHSGHGATSRQKPANGRIVYAALTQLPNGDYQSAIYTMSHTGRDRRMLISETSPGGDFPYNQFTNPTWSPDGTEIAYRVGDPDCINPAQLWIMNADGTGRRNLIAGTQNRCIDDDGISFSPSGKRLIFSEADGDDTKWVDVSSGRIHDLAGGRGGSFSPTFSHSGAWIVAEGGANDPEHPLFIARPYKSGYVRTLPSGFMPSWSPDDRRVMYTTWQRSARGHYRIWTINADGTGRRAVTPKKILAAYGQYSPNGNRVLYLHEGRKQASLWVANIDGGHRSQVSPSYPVGVYQQVITGFDWQAKR